MLGCSQVLQSVNLELNTEDNSTQDSFNVVEKVLTSLEAQKQNASPYHRFVSQTGRGNNAKIVSENKVIQSNFPHNTKKPVYRIGIGDVLTFSKLIENNQTQLNSDINWPTNSKSFLYTLGVGDLLTLTLLREEETLSQMKASDSNDGQNLLLDTQTDVVLSSTGRIGSDGSLLLLEIGQLEAKGKTLNELRSEVRNILIRNGTSPRFQLEIVEFKSKKAYLTINDQSRIILLADQETTLRDVLTTASVGPSPGIITQVRLQRNGEEYLMSLRGIFSPNSPNVTISADDHIFVEDSSTNTITSTSKVGHDGNLVFAGIGKINTVGKTLEELKLEMSSVMDKIPGSQNAFQVEITKYSSQTALVTIPGQTGGVIRITDIPLGLDEVLSERGLTIDGNFIIRINLKRGGRSYSFTLKDLLNPSNKRVYLQPDDRVTTESLPYKKNKVFILGAVNPQIFEINPSNRESLADILFTSGGVLSSSNAQRSEVYLLRGNNPVVAYHLDAQSPTRLIVANNMELRPNDILYVAEQPIISFSRTLATISPLRILLRDIQDGNIP